MEKIDIKELERIKEQFSFNVTNNFRTYNNISIAEYTDSYNTSK